MTKICIGICSGGSVRTETMISLVANLINLGQKGIAPNLLAQVGGYVAVNRNQLVKNAIEAKASHLMFIDADMIFPDDGIYTLLSHNKDIIGANYNVRLDPTSGVYSSPTATVWDTKIKNNVKVRNEDMGKKPFKAYSIATGFMLINLSIFKKLKSPYFVEWETEDNKHTTEDVDFCKKANKAGIEIWCDPTLKLGHIGQAVY